MVYYFSKVAPEKFPHIQRELAQVFRPTEFPDWIIQACGLHFFVEQASVYEDSGPSIPDPDEMLYRLEGDCQDQSVLLASMYLSVGLDVRFVRIKDEFGEGSHVFPEVYCPAPDRELVCSAVRKFYDREFDRRIDEIYFEGNDSELGFWLIADPEFSRYVGDVESLRRDDYVHDTAGGWQWTNLVEVQEARL